jgi:hypothetical protein
MASFKLTLQLDDLAHFLVLNQGAVTGKLLSEGRKAGGQGEE